MSPSDLVLHEAEGVWRLELLGRYAWIHALPSESQLHALDGNWLVLLMAVWSNQDRELAQSLLPLEELARDRVQLGILLYDEPGSLEQFDPTLHESSTDSWLEIRDGRLHDRFSATSLTSLRAELERRFCPL